MTPKEERDSDLKALHAPGKLTRLQVTPNGADLREAINGSTRILRSGEVFDHPAPKRAAQLVDLGLVRPTTLKTSAELALEKDEEAAMVDLVADQFKERAKKVIADRKIKLDKLQASLDKMTPEIVLAEAKKRELKVDGLPTGEVVKAIMADELETLKAEV